MTYPWVWNGVLETWVCRECRCFSGHMAGCSLAETRDDVGRYRFDEGGAHAPKVTKLQK